MNTITRRTRGQAMTEFALTLPILTLVIFGLIDFGRLLFTYAQASNALRNAVRYAEVIGYADATSKVYLDCPGMTDAAGKIFFAESQTIDIKYIDASTPLGSPTTYTCATTNLDDKLENGDILEIRLRAKVKLIAFPMADIPFDFVGRRTIVKKIDIGGECIGTDEDLCDRDFDGLADGWERAEFGGISVYNATDDPDGDGCNNGCEEINGTDPTLADTGAPGDTTGIPTPPQPTNFTATANCSTGKVSFSWDAVSPIPSRGEIRNRATGLISVRLDDQPLGLITDNTCVNCDTINTTNGYKEYVLSFTNGTPPTAVKGPDSVVVKVACAAQPPAPINFFAQVDCAAKTVDFSWIWGVTEPRPTRAEIRNATNNQVISNITNTTQTTCIDCVTSFPTNGTRSYYIVAFNGIVGVGPGEVVSLASNTATATCPSTTATITGTLWGDSGNPRNREMDGTEDKFKTQTITLYSLDAGGPSYTATTNTSGTYTFTNLPPGDYKMVVPLSIASGGNWALDVVRGSMSAVLVHHEITFRIVSGQIFTLNFGYKK